MEQQKTNSLKTATFKNIAIVIISQFFSICVSLILGFVVPKIIDEYQYSYWQTFLLYYGYASFFTFGLIDGLFLRYSKYNLDALPKKEIRLFFRTCLILVLAVSLIIAIVGLIALDNEYRMIAFLVGGSVLVHNLWAFNYTILNTTNRLKKYAFFVFLQRMLYLAFVVILLLFKNNNFEFYCLSELASELIVFVLSIFLNKGLYFGEVPNTRDSLYLLKITFSCGILLLIANFAGNFLVLGAKTFIQFNWDELTFGKVSFGFSVSNLFLSLITTVSLVLFPSLKRINESSLPLFYQKVRKIIPLAMFCSMIFYFPLCKALSIWLPNYSSSLLYLGILLPIIISISITNLLTNNYFRAYRKEKIMTLINVATVAFACVLYAIFTFVYKNLLLVLISLVFVSFARLFASELFVSRIIQKRFAFELNLLEMATSALFILCTFTSRLLYGFLFYLVALIAYCTINWRAIKALFEYLLALLRKKHE